MASILLAAALVAPVIAGTITHGGAVPGAAVVRVTSLDDAGPGSLRAALQVADPKVIVFDVGGVIHLASDLRISTAHTTIAGQSAPAPIVLSGGSLRIRANDIVVQHVAVRPGPGATQQINGNRDALSIGGSKRQIQDVRVENVSLAWSVDEGADIAGNTRNVTFRNNIVAEALRNAGHPKGRHSMGMLISKDNQAVAVTGNLFAANMFRNPVVAQGGSVFVGYNLIVDPGENAIHFYDAPGPSPLRASVVGNIVQAGPDTARNVTAVQIPDGMTRNLPDAEISLSQNQSDAGPLTNRGDFTLVAAAPVVPPDGFESPGDVRAFVLGHAGARPAARDGTDTRIVAQSARASIRIIDGPPEYSESAPVQATAAVPEDPFGTTGRAGLLRIEAWLCGRHLELGGPSTPECPGNARDYRNLIHPRLSQRR